MDRKERKIIRWMKYKAMGKQKFVMIYGRLAGGLCGSLITSAINLLFYHDLIDYSAMRHIEWFIFRFVMYGIIGGFIAENRWNVIIRKLGPPPEDS